MKDIADRRDKLTSKTGYATTMPVSDQIIFVMKSGTYRNIPLSEIDLLKAAQREGITAEEIQYQFDAIFDAGDNVYKHFILRHRGQELCFSSRSELRMSG